MNPYTTRTVTGQLPGGYVDETGQLRSHFWLRPLSGQEEEMMAAQSSAPSALVTRLLSQCLLALDDISPVPETIVRQLLIADRQFLLLKLREVTFGNQISLLIHCPNANCGEKIDVAFTTADIPVERGTDGGPLFTATLAATAVNGNGDAKAVTFRLPIGADQEELAAVLAEDESDAAFRLLARCVRQLGDIVKPNATQLRQLPSAALAEIEEAIAVAAPAVGMTMEGRCPFCNTVFAIPFDLQTFVLQECKRHVGFLYQEVHYLAYHYHWSEADIIAMSRPKRRQYIQLLAAEIERRTYG